MKATFIAALTTMALFGTVAIADTKVVLGCEVAQVDGANYFNKVDPNCTFAVDGGKDYVGGGVAVVAFDTDNDPSTPRVNSVAVNIGNEWVALN